MAVDNAGRDQGQKSRDRDDPQPVEFEEDDNFFHWFKYIITFGFEQIKGKKVRPRLELTLKVLCDNLAHNF